MLISIASGKGGTGKTAFALMLAAAHPEVTLVDCDVEEPNCHLFLQPEWQEPARTVEIMIPVVDNSKCNGCGSCSAVCLFNAIAIAGEQALLFDELCHSCGGCLLVCPHGAMAEGKKEVGILQEGRSTVLPQVNLHSGTMHVGMPSSVPLIKAIKAVAKAIPGDVLLDCPPGTACSMVTAVKDSDYCILVTEPTPFGQHDVQLAMNITALLGIATGVVINKSDGGSGDAAIEALCHSRQLPVLAKIPHSLTFASEYAAGRIPEEFRSIATAVWSQLQQKVVKA